jgi:hypothetical protein
VHKTQGRKSAEEEQRGHLNELVSKQDFELAARPMENIVMVKQKKP